jgi:hypothetical protein
MDIEAMVQNIDEHIARLELAPALLTDHTAPLKRGFPPTPTKRRMMSAEGRARIAAAQKKRWAKKK